MEAPVVIEGDIGGGRDGVCDAVVTPDGREGISDCMGGGTEGLAK